MFCYIRNGNDQLIAVTSRPKAQTGGQASGIQVLSNCFSVNELSVFHKSNL